MRDFLPKKNLYYEFIFKIICLLELLLFIISKFKKFNQI